MIDYNEAIKRYCAVYVIDEFGYIHRYADRFKKILTAIEPLEKYEPKLFLYPDECKLHFGSLDADIVCDVYEDDLCILCSQHKNDVMHIKEANLNNVVSVFEQLISE